MSIQLCISLGRQIHVVRMYYALTKWGLNWMKFLVKTNFDNITWLYHPCIRPLQHIRVHKVETWNDFFLLLQRTGIFLLMFCSRCQFLSLLASTINVELYMYLCLRLHCLPELTREALSIFSSWITPVCHIWDPHRFVIHFISIIFWICFFHRQLLNPS